MPLSMYQASVPMFRQQLTTLAAVLAKGAAHASARKIDPAVLLGMRLAPDMFTLTRQVQIASDGAKGGAARLAGVEVPKYDDNETTFEQLQARIQKTLDFLATLKPAQFEGADTREITIPMGGQPKTFGGRAYLLHQVFPNFFFHCTTAYAILRHAGVEIGKRDFIGTFDPKS